MSRNPTAAKRIKTLVGTTAIGGGALAVLVALAAWNLGNFLFFVIAGRLLGPADYGLIAALLGATMIFYVPAGAFQYAMAREAAGSGRPNAAAALYRHAWVRIALASAALAALATLVILLVGLATPLPAGELIVTVAVVAPMGVLLLSLGWLQGRNRFGAFSWSLGLLGALRPPALLFFALLGSGVYAALGSSAFVMALIAWFAWYLTRGDIRAISVVEHADLHGMWSRYLRALPPLAIGFLGLAVLTNLDLVAATLFLDADAAGHFSAAAILAKGLLLLPQAAAVVLLPRIAKRRADGTDSSGLLSATTLLVIVGGLLATLLFAIAGGWIVEVTFGSEFAPAAGLLVPFALTTTLLGVVIILINHHAAQARNPYVIAIALVAAAQPVLFALFHQSAEALIVVDAIVYLAAILIHEAMQARRGESITKGVARLLRSRTG